MTDSLQALVLVAALVAQAPVVEVIADIQVHGNHATSDEELLALSGVAPGDRFERGTPDAVAARLRQTGRFKDVQVLKRYASIADSSRITLVIIVNEGPVRLVMPGADDPDGVPRIVRRRFAGNLMWLPVLGFEDGYGATYGVRLAYLGVGGERSRLSFPLTWGGRRQAGADFSHSFTRGPASRFVIGATIRQDENPAYRLDDTRRRAWARLEHAAGPLGAGWEAGWQRVDFGGARDDVRSFGADVTLDTRLNPVLPRNAVFARASWERYDITPAGTFRRTRLDGRGYLGLARQTVLAVRAAHESFDRAAPLYLRPVLGGWSSLRGFRAGAFTGDTVVTGSTELLVPLGSPLRTGQAGVSAFVDAGTAYDAGERLADARWQTGFGGSVWFSMPAFRVSLAVAHGRGATTRVHLGGGFAF